MKGWPLLSPVLPKARLAVQRCSQDNEKGPGVVPLFITQMQDTNIPNFLASQFLYLIQHVEMIAKD
ncbi:hypothetical protein SH501x_001845 [Pirellulaceae bacterium SH501]